jgi:hypothetical protein
MNTALSDTILYVTGKQGIENTSQYELETMIAEYPYFAPAQLVYTTKLKSENSFKLQTQVQKTGLFFNNFKWLQYQLMEVGANSFKSFSSKDYSIEEESIAEQPKPLESIGIESLPIVETTLHTNETPLLVNATIESKVNEKPYDFMSNMSIPTVEEIKGIMSGINDRREAIENAVEPIVVEKMESDSTNQIETKVEVLEDVNTKRQVATENVTSYTTITNEEVLQNEPIKSANDIHAQIAALKASWYSQHPEAVADELAEVVHNVPEVVKAETAPQVTEKPLFPNIDAEIASFKKDWNKPASEVSTQPLPFETEPYYTIDYFASQGIKFDYSQAPHDKLTTKMLRFTDWLKKMKTVKPEQEAMSDDPELDSAIQNIASMSNQTKEVVTETMAAIFAKQGKTEKAIQLYIKLSFLIPDKSAYFATQIKELKGI